MIGLVMFRGLWKKHVANEISTDASQSRWDGVIHRQPTVLVLGDFWEAPSTKENINIKEFWAVAKVLEALPEEIGDRRVPVQVDNQAVLHTLMGRGGLALGMYPVAKRIFHLTQEENLHLTMSFVASANNPADEFSRNSSDSDSMLSPKCWK